MWMKASGIRYRSVTLSTLSDCDRVKVIVWPCPGRRTYDAKHSRTGMRVVWRASWLLLYLMGTGPSVCINCLSPFAQPWLPVSLHAARLLLEPSSRSRQHVRAAGRTPICRHATNLQLWVGVTVFIVTVDRGGVLILHNWDVYYVHW